MGHFTEKLLTNHVWQKWLLDRKAHLIIIIWQKITLKCYLAISKKSLLLNQLEFCINRFLLEYFSVKWTFGTQTQPFINIKKYFWNLMQMQKFEIWPLTEICLLNLLFATFKIHCIYLWRFFLWFINPFYYIHSWVLLFSHLYTLSVPKKNNLQFFFIDLFNGRLWQQNICIVLWQK
jgi:hypothetical protein